MINCVEFGNLHPVVQYLYVCPDNWNSAGGALSDHWIYNKDGDPLVFNRSEEYFDSPHVNLYGLLEFIFASEHF